MSSLFENIRVALGGLGSNKLRSALTMLGITIGVSAVILLVSVGQAVETFVIEGFQGIGANLLVVFGAQDDQGRFVPLTQNDVDAVSDVFRVPDALFVMPQRNLTRTIIADGNETRLVTQGVTTTYTEVFSREVIAGRFITQDDIDTAARVIVLGQSTVDRLFPDRFPLGQSVRISGIRFTVIGVLDASGGGISGFFDDDPNNIALIPITTAQTRLSGERALTGERPVSIIFFQARDSNRIPEAAQQARRALREERDINFRDEDNFIVFTQTEILDTLEQITGLLTLFLALLAAISLLVGGIGIMNIMLVTVTERTREIGLRKAVGAQRGDILLQFLTEATVLALVGGAAGVGIAALGSAAATAIIPDITVTVQFSSVLLATFISVAIGVFFGIYPANRAAALNPIDALRYE